MKATASARHDQRGHAGTPLIHEGSEDVVLATVFGVVKNLSFETVLNPWLGRVTGGAIPASDDWHLSFWKGQHVPAGLDEGSTNVDLEMDSDPALVFAEVKLDAPPSAGTTHDPNRNQLVRNLDIGYERAARAGKKFAVVYVTADTAEPAIVAEIRLNEQAFHANKSVPPERGRACLYWCPWGWIGDVIHEALERDGLNETEKSFAFDLLAYLKAKGLWNGVLSEKLMAQIQGDKLYRMLLPAGMFVARGQGKPVLDQSWRNNAWEEADMRNLLGRLGDREKALLKVLAEAPDGSLKQRAILNKLAFLGGSPDALSALKRGISKACKGQAKAPLLPPGSGSGDNRRHEINSNLGPLRDVVIAIAKGLQIPAHLLR
jgi:hypothetical protein